MTKPEQRPYKSIESSQVEDRLAIRIQSHLNAVVSPLIDELATCPESHRSELAARIHASLESISSILEGSCERRLSTLTPRELEICKLVKQGLSSKEIADRLHTSEGTVRNQRKSIRRKLGLTRSSGNLQTVLNSI